MMTAHRLKCQDWYEISSRDTDSVILFWIPEMFIFSMERV